MSELMSIDSLRLELEAHRQTIEVLADVVERRQRDAVAPLPLLQHQIHLERVVAQKTKALEQTVRELGETQAQLLHAHKLEAVGQLAAGVAHEINTPMQYIGDNVRFLQKAFGRLLRFLEEVVSTREALERGALREDAADRLADAERAARLDFIRERIPRALEQSIEGVSAVSHIVAAMKEFSHPGTHEKELVDLNHLVEVTGTLSRNEWKYVAELKLDLHPDLPLVPALQSELNQVLINLVVNAAHAIDARGQSANLGAIVVRTWAEEGWVCISVRDDGCGMPDGVLTRIFEPFFTTKEVGRGTGQGLAIARSIVVTKHGGAIDVESAPGLGSCFTLRLPCPSESKP